MTEKDDYEVVFTPPARRALTDQLPETVAAAVIDFLTTTLITQPRRVGKSLRAQLSGIWAARSGTYRVRYRLNDDRREVIIVRVDRRRDAYRPP